MKILSTVLVQRFAQLLTLIKNGFRPSGQGEGQRLFCLVASSFFIGVLLILYPLKEDTILGYTIFFTFIVSFPWIVNYLRKILGKEALNMEDLNTFQDDETKDFPFLGKPWWHYLYITGWIVLICSFPFLCLSFYLLINDGIVEETVLSMGLFLYADYRIIKDAKRRQRERK